MGVLPGFPTVHFDFGALGALAGELASRGIKRPLIITDTGLTKHGVVDMVRAALPGNPDIAVYDGIPPNPTVAGIEGALALYRNQDCDGIIGLGGGSVLDSGKALRVAATHPEPVIEYLKDPSKITANVAPYITLPTTAGTGAEITFGGGIHPEPGKHQLGIRSPHVKPDLVICDPELTLTLPPILTAGTGMDALGHCVEGFLSNNYNPPTEAIALDGIARVVTYIERAVANGGDREARWHMLMAALEGGMSIYMGLGPVHVLGHIFADSPLHHGALITASAPPVLRFYKARGDAALSERLDRVASAMKLAPGTDAATGIAELNTRLGLSNSVREMGYPNDDPEMLAGLAMNIHFNATAPLKPTEDQYRHIIAEALG
ncbi:MAG: iron-containing alcohol dehydrogenase [Proteobacteria bacterium]|nr:iron-containing alcohol dehydrogenase [Pseudomonadota bacterium]MDA1325218.1 iron-containing alcohol dehydrogenase [Pseudomonadota bacterium]